VPGRVPNELFLWKIADCSNATVAYHLEQFAHGLSEALKSFIFGLMPRVVQWRLLRIQ
jgi:hypothetical protein